MHDRVASLRIDLYGAMLTELIGKLVMQGVLSTKDADDILKKGKNSVRHSPIG